MDSVENNNLTIKVAVTKEQLMQEIAETREELTRLRSGRMGKTHPNHPVIKAFEGCLKTYEAMLKNWDEEDVGG